jgi:hypothetical protein
MTRDLMMDRSGMTTRLLLHVTENPRLSFSISRQSIGDIVRFIYDAPTRTRALASCQTGQRAFGNAGAVQFLGADLVFRNRSNHDISSEVTSYVDDAGACSSGCTCLGDAAIQKRHWIPRFTGGKYSYPEAQRYRRNLTSKHR